MPDSLGFLDAVGGLPEQLAAAHRSARAALDPVALPSPDDIDHIVVLGMGGSGIAGDVLAAVANATLPVPVVVLKQFRTPRFVGPRTLAFAVSYSGDTEETLQMAAGALDAGARLVAVSRGGELEALARERGAVHVACPPGYLPRAALGALLTPLFVVLERMGLLPDAGEWLDAAGRQLTARREKCGPDVEPPPTRRARSRGGSGDDPDLLRRGCARRRRRAALEVRRERERQGAGVLERVPRARPQRDLRVGPARRRHPSGLHARRAAPRLRARAARAAVRARRAR